MMSVVKQKFSELRILDSSNYDFSQYSRVEIGEKKLKSIALKKKSASLETTEAES